MPYPPLETTHHLANYLIEMGCGMQSGMGFTPLTSSEIMNWSQGVGVHLSSWAFSTLLDASRAVVDSYSSSDGERTPPPWATHETIIEHRKTVSDQMRSAMEGLIAAQKNKPTRQGGR